MLSNHPRLRLSIYLMSIGAAVAAPIIAVSSPEYGAAAATAAGVLAGAAGIVASGNLTKGDTGDQ